MSFQEVFVSTFAKVFFFIVLTAQVVLTAPIDVLDSMELLLLGDDPASVRQGAELILEDDPDDATANESLGWIAILEGRDTEALDHFLLAIIADPTSLRAEALLRDIVRFSEQVEHFRELKTVCEDILQKNDSNFETDLLARRWLLYFAREDRDTELIERLETELGYLTDWLLVAPFIRSGNLDLYREFEPEVRIRETYELPSIGERGWSVMPAGAYQGYASFDNLSSYPRGVGYALTYVYLPRDGRYRFDLISDDSVVVWVDGTKVLERDAVAGYPAVEVNGRGFEAEAGWHRVLVKCHRNTASSSARVPIGWGFQLSLTEFDGEGDGGPVEGLECRADTDLENELAGDSVEAFSIMTARSVTTNQTPLDWYFHRAVISAHLEDYDRAVLEMEELIDRRYLIPLEKASSRADDGPSLEEALATQRDTHPESVLLRLALGWVLDADGSEERLGRARAQYNRVAEAAPETVPAQLALADIEAAEGKYWSALERVNSVVGRAPGSVRAWLALADLYRLKSITPREREALEKARSVEPGHMDALYEMSLFLRRHQQPVEAIETLQRLVALVPDHQSAWLDLADLLQTAGRYREAAEAYLEVLELNPYEVDAYLELARCHRKGEFGNRLDDYRRMIEYAPYDYRGYVQLALALEEDEGRVDRELYRKALEQYPAKDWLRGYLSWRNGVTGDEFMPDIEEIIASAPDAEDYPEADGVNLLDYLRIDVHADFAYSFAERRIYKFFTQAGVDRWAEMIIPETQNTEIIYAQTYTPDGRVLDATVITPTDDGLAVSLEGAAPGAIVDLYYRQYSEVRTIYDLLDYWSNRFYFREYSDPLLISRLVVTAPEEVALSFDTLNFRGDRDRYMLPDGYTRNGTADIPVERRVAYVHEVTGSEAIISEGLMPNLGFIAPVVGLSTIEEPEDFYDWFWGKAITALVPDEQVKELAHRLTGELDNPMEKAQALYSYVVTQIKDRGGSIFFPNSVRETYYRRSGRQIDKLLLWMALAGEVGLEPELCLTRSRWDTPMLEDAFSPIDYSDAVARLPIGGDIYMVDFNVGRAALGEYLPDYDGQPYWRCEARKMERFDNRDPLEQRIERTARINLDENGHGGGTLEETYYGLSAGSRVSYLDPETASRTLDGELNSIFPGASLDRYELYGLEDLQAPFGYRMDFVARNIAIPREEGFVLGVVLAPLELSSAFITRSERTYPMEVSNLVAIVEEAYFTLPDGWTPTADSLFTERIEKGLNRYLLEIKRDPEGSDQLILRREVVIPIQRVEPSDYGKFREFCRRVDELERRRITIVYE